MKTSEVSSLQFANWSFEQDLSNGAFEDEGITSWEDVLEDEKEIYIWEAEEYLKQPPYFWPIDILRKVDDGNLYISGKTTLLFSETEKGLIVN